jgi:hypothetical protein
MHQESAQQLGKAFVAFGDSKSAESVRLAFKRGGIRAVYEWQLKQDLDKAEKKKYVSPFRLAWDYARLHRKDETLAALESAYRERSPWLIFLQKGPTFDFLHSDRRYRALVNKIGLPPAY